MNKSIIFILLIVGVILVSGCTQSQPTKATKVIQINGKSAYIEHTGGFNYSIVVDNKIIRSHIWADTNSIIDIGGKLAYITCDPAAYPYNETDCDKYFVIYGDKEGKRYDEIDDLRDFNGKPAYIAYDFYKPSPYVDERINATIVAGDKELVWEGGRIDSFRVVDGMIIYYTYYITYVDSVRNVSTVTTFYDDKLGLRKHQKKIDIWNVTVLGGKKIYLSGGGGVKRHVVDYEEGEKFIEVHKIDEVNGKLIYSYLVTENKQGVVYDGKQIGENYEWIDYVIVGDKTPIYIAGENCTYDRYFRADCGRSFIVYNGKEGKKYPGIRTESIKIINGKLAYIVNVLGDSFGQAFVVYGEEEGKTYGYIFNMREVDGKLSYQAGDNCIIGDEGGTCGTYYLVKDGQETIT